MNEQTLSVPEGDGADYSWTRRFWDSIRRSCTISGTQLIFESSSPTILPGELACGANVQLPAWSTISISLCRRAVGGTRNGALRSSAFAEPLEHQRPLQTDALLAQRSVLNSFPSECWAPARTSFGLPKNLRNAVTEFFRWVSNSLESAG